MANRRLTQIKKLYLIAIVAILTMAMFFGTALASNNVGPAPNAGDGVPDGSGLARPDNPGTGPAPNSGDGIPDGSGF